MDLRPRHLIAGAALAGILGAGGLQDETTDSGTSDEDGNSETPSDSSTAASV